MIVITAGTQNLKRFIRRQAERCAEYGYGHRIFDLGGLGMGMRFRVTEKDLTPRLGKSLPPATFKLDLLSVSRSETVCWLDGDCIPVRPFEPDGDWDVAVTLRSLSEINKHHHPATRYLNSGAVWLRPGATEFLRLWKTQALKADSDQAGLNLAVAPGYGPDEWKQSLGKTLKSAAGSSVRVLDATEWNCWHFPPPQSARILHFKSDRRHLAGEYL